MGRIVIYEPNATTDLTLNEQATKIVDIGDIELTTNTSYRNPTTLATDSFSDFQSLSTISVSSNAGRVLSSTNAVTPIPRLRYNRKMVRHFSKWGSLEERINASILNIINKFPASLYIKNVDDNGNVRINVFQNIYNPSTNESTFFLSTSSIKNPFLMPFLVGASLPSNTDIDLDRNLNLYYYKYDLYFNDVRYPIVNFIGARQYANDVLTITIKGAPFPNFDSAQEFYITPNLAKRSEFYNSLDDFEYYMLDPNGETEFDFNFSFLDDIESDAGIILETEIKFKFPKEDLFNISISNTDYDVFYQELITFAQKKDNILTNILLRKYVSTNLQVSTLTIGGTEFENNVENLIKLFRVYGRSFDELNLYIDNIGFFKEITINGEDSAPDQYLSSILDSYGFTLPDSVLQNTDLMRIIGANAANIFKTKGTRAGVELIFGLFGIPMDIVEINEHIYQSNKLNLTRLNQLLTWLNLTGYTITASTPNGYPYIAEGTDNLYFQCENYFGQFINILPQIENDIIFINTTGITFYDVLNDDFNDRTTPYNFYLTDNTGSPIFCYTGNTSIINDFKPELYYDVCEDCTLPILDKAQEICVTPIPLYTGCTPFIVDVLWDCLSKTQAQLDVRVYGGNPPYRFVGGQSGDTVNVGDFLDITVYDSDNCPSNNVVGVVNCISPCLDNPVSVSMDYTCNQNNVNLNDGTATVNITVTGGVPPYTFAGAGDGDIFLDGEIVTVQVVDSRGCKSNVAGVVIDCPEAPIVPCGFILLQSSLETINTEPAEKTAKVTLAYIITGLPQSVYIDTVQVVTTGVGASNAYLVGSPVISNFTNVSGADTFSLDFFPNNIPMSFTGKHVFTITLTNGCVYTYEVQFTVNPRRLGNSDRDNTTLYP